MFKKILSATVGCIFIAVIWSFIAVISAFSQEKEEIRYLEEEKVYFITLTRKLEPIHKLPANVSVIDAKKIANSNAQTIVELLKQERGIIVKDYYGFGTKAEVDMRGFGETGASNVLVLIDGRKVNQIDLSNVDWTQIPLDQIERIEIIHGSAGAVLYGDNAVGGVINIITKKIEEKQKLELGGNLGSYLTNNLIFAFQKKNNKFNYSLRISQFATEGYRKNNNFSKKDFGLQTELKLTRRNTIVFRGNYHSDNFGLPGYIKENDWKNGNLTTTYTPDDKVKSEDIYADLLLKSELSKIGNSESELSWRKRSVDTDWISWLWSDTRNIQTLGVSQRVLREDIILGKKNNLISGIEFYESKQDIETQLKKTTIARNSLALFFDNRFSLTDILALNFGMRSENTKYTYEDSNLNKDRDTHYLSAWKTGLGWFYSGYSNLFLNIGTSFRLPKTDEYYKFNPVTYEVIGWNKTLKPQKAVEIDLSIKHSLSKILSLNFTIYRKDVTNEIYYNPYTWSNKNYEKTLHQGIEAETVFAPRKNFSTTLNYSFTNAKFTQGSFTNKEIPAVPKHKASMSISFNLLRNFVWTLNDTYVSSQWFISDQKNETDKLKSYNLMDTKLSFQKGFLQMFVGIKNLTDAKYAEYAILGATGKVYYPAARRSFVSGISFSF